MAIECLLPWGLLVGHMVGDFLLQDDRLAAYKTKSSPVCAIHCLLYTIGVFSGCWMFWLPWWFYVVTGVLHFPVDRFGLARKLMSFRHESFAGPPFGPWSTVIVDQTIHFIAILYTASAVYWVR